MIVATWVLEKQSAWVIAAGLSKVICVRKINFCWPGKLLLKWVHLCYAELVSFLFRKQCWADLRCTFFHSVWISATWNPTNELAGCFNSFPCWVIFHDFMSAADILFSKLAFSKNSFSIIRLDPDQAGILVGLILSNLFAKVIGRLRVKLRKHIHLYLIGDKNISILHLSCRTSDLQFSLVLQTHALVL